MTEAPTTHYVDGSVEGYLHTPEVANGLSIVLTHGAGSNSKAPLIVAVANNLASAGYTVLRTDLAFRRLRPKGPPLPAIAVQDRKGLEAAVHSLQEKTGFPTLLAGHSYGGRQSSMLVAEKPDLAVGLLLLSYPLHPPDKPNQLRTAHFPNLRTPCVFVHGEKDPFGTIDEMREQLAAIPVTVTLIPVPKTGHDLNRGKLPWKEVLGALLEAAGRA